MFSTADPFFLTFTPKRDADSISHRRPQNGAALRMAPPSKLAPPSKWRRPQNGATLKIGATLKMAPPSKWRRPQNWRHPQNGAALKMAPPSKWHHPQNGAALKVGATLKMAPPLPLFTQFPSVRTRAARRPSLFCCAMVRPAHAHCARSPDRDVPL